MDHDRLFLATGEFPQGFCPAAKWGWLPLERISEVLDHFTSAHIARVPREVKRSPLLFLAVVFSLQFLRCIVNTIGLAKHSRLQVIENPHIHDVARPANGGRVPVDGCSTSVANPNPLRRRTTAHNSQ